MSITPLNQIIISLDPNQNAALGSDPLRDAATNLRYYGTDTSEEIKTLDRIDSRIDVITCCAGTGTVYLIAQALPCLPSSLSSYCCSLGLISCCFATCVLGQGYSEITEKTENVRAALMRKALLLQQQEKSK